MAAFIWIDIGSRSGFFPDGMIPLPRPVLTCLVAFAWGEFYQRGLSYQSLRFAWKLEVYNFIQILKEPMSLAYVIVTVSRVSGSLLKKGRKMAELPLPTAILGVVIFVCSAYCATSSAQEAEVMPYKTAFGRGSFAMKCMALGQWVPIKPSLT